MFGAPGADISSSARAPETGLEELAGRFRPALLRFFCKHVSQNAHVEEAPVRVRSAGAEVIKPAQGTFYGGYAGYFRDPNGHLWEVVWNPASIPAEH